MSKNPLDNTPSWVSPMWDGNEPAEANQQNHFDTVRRRMSADIAEMVRTKAGKRFFTQLMIQAGAFSERHRGNAEDIFFKGQRVWALHVWNLLGEADKQLQSQLSPPYEEWPYGEETPKD